MTCSPKKPQAKTSELQTIAIDYRCDIRTLSSGQNPISELLFNHGVVRWIVNAISRRAVNSQDTVTARMVFSPLNCNRLQ
jgi:hypothetical protein